MHGVILDRNAPNELFQYFTQQGFRIVRSYSIPQLCPAVRSHPDMQICRINSRTFVAAPECYDYYRISMPKCRIIRGERGIGSVYPEDILYNAAVYNNIAFHHSNYTDEALKRYFLGNSIHIIPVKQGYSKCNICFLNESALITSDPSIQKAAEEQGIEVLKIQNSSIINLAGFDFGFLGGASGKIRANELVICGDLTLHPEYDLIYRFCQLHQMQIVSAYSGAIQDVGSILQFED